MSSRVSPDSTMDPAIRARITVVMIGCLVFAAAIVGRAAFVQIGTDPRLEKLARRQFQARVLVRPRRGGIVDRNGEPLAVNLEMNSLAANPSKLKNNRTIARLLSKAVDLPYSRLLQRFNEKREFIWVKRQLADADMGQLKKWGIIDAGGVLPAGLWLVKENKRVYPHGETAAHVVGDVNIDSDGVEGVELWQNEKLRGNVVSVDAIKDALGRPTFIDAVAAKHVQDGKQIVLTIDASLQFAVEQELRASVQKTGAKGGSVVVMNAVTGEILAMASAPTFDPNNKLVSPDRRRNRVVTDGFEPGSTLKAVLLSSALSHGWKLTDQIWGERGQLVVQGHRITEAEAHEKFEWLSLKKMLQVSSNVGSAKLALKLGADHYFSTLKSFGFGSRTGLEFPGEIAGRVPPRKAWQPLALANLGFGQGLLATPLQMTRAYAVFLNGGWLVQPTLIKSDAPPRRILSQRIADDVLEALESVSADGGTGIKARLTGYRVAGKTGTAQLVDPSTRKYAKNRYNVSFIGFVLGVNPKIVIFAGLNEPRGVYYASETAAPLFREVLNAVTGRFGLPSQGVPRLAEADISRKDRTLAERVRRLLDGETSTTDRVVTTQAAPTVPGRLRWVGASTGGGQMWAMPSLRGLTAREALRALNGHKFRLELHGAGIIRAQLPEEGKPVVEGDLVKLTLTEP